MCSIASVDDDYFDFEKHRLYKAGLLSRSHCSPDVVVWASVLCGPVCCVWASLFCVGQSWAPSQVLHLTSHWCSREFHFLLKMAL